MTSEGRSPLDPSDAAVAAALSAPLPGEDDGELVTLEELADRAELSLPLLEALVRERLLLPAVDDPPRFRMTDASSVRAALELVDAGLPLAELLELARRADASLREIAEHAVDLFARYVRDPAVGFAPSEDAAGERMVGALHRMLPATEQLIAQHLRRLIIAEARELLETEREQ